MTLSEIKTKVPELQTKIADLVKQNEADNKTISDIEAKIQEVKDLKEAREAELQLCNDFIKKHSGNTSKTIQSEVAKKIAGRNKLEGIIKGQKIAIRKLEDDRDDIKKPGTDYAKRADEAEKIQKDLDAICDLLVQDPTINSHMQTAVMVKFDNQIKNEEKKKENNKKAIENIRKGLKNGTKDGLKRTLEDLKEGNDKYKAARTDDSIDANDALNTYRTACKKLIGEIKTKYGVNIKQSDVDHILEEVDKGNLDSLTIPSLEKAMEKTDAVIKKLEESRDKRLETIQSKIAPDAQLTQEIEDAQEVIDNLTQEISDLTNEITISDDFISRIDTEIADKESALGEPSDDYKNLKEAEQELKDSHIITPELVPDLNDENSVIRKRFELLVRSDLLVRQAFQKCKSVKDETKRPEALQKLQEEIDRYQRISEDIASLSGYDVEAWHNYLLETLNEKILDGETLDNAYYHTENEAFKDVLDDKDTIARYTPMNEYEAVEKSLKEIDEAQEKILKGDFSPNVEEMFNEKDNGYYDRMKTLDEAGKFKDIGCSIYDFIKGNIPVKRKMSTRIGMFFKNLGHKFKAKKLFEIPEKNQAAIDKYKNANKEELKDEIEGRKELDFLKEKREQEITAKEAFEVQKAAKEDELKIAEEKKDDLEKQVATKTGTSPIQATDMDYRTIHFESDVVKAATEKVERDEDEGR